LTSEELEKLAIAEVGNIKQRLEKSFIWLFWRKKHPEATYWDLIRQADFNITPRTCKKILQRHYIGNWRKAKRILLTEEDAQRRLEFAEEWSHPEKLAQLKLAFFF
jgi:hypothetical protein